MTIDAEQQPKPLRCPDCGRLLPSRSLTRFLATLLYHHPLKMQRPCTSCVHLAYPVLPGLLRREADDGGDA